MIRSTQTRRIHITKSKYTTKDIDRFKAIKKIQRKRDDARFPQLTRDHKPV